MRADREPSAALDGLRAYAALVVISVHIYFFGDVAHGVTSLWLFFVLSSPLVIGE